MILLAGNIIYRDRLRNKVFRWVGVLPLDDFDVYTNSVLKVFGTFENFTKRTARFADVVMKRLNIKDLDDEQEKLKDETDFREMYR